MDDNIRAVFERYRDRLYDDTDEDMQQHADDAKFLADAYFALMARESTPIIDETITLDPAHADIRGEYHDVSLLLASADELKPRPELEFGKRYRIRIEEV